MRRRLLRVVDVCDRVCYVTCLCGLSLLLCWRAADCFDMRMVALPRLLASAGIR